MQEFLITQLQNYQAQVVLYVTGVGSTLLSEFTLHPGSSSYALESANFYACGSLQKLLDHSIEKYVSEQVAYEMSIAALIQAHQILRNQEDSNSQKFLYTVGIGLTGAIGSVEPRKGLHHAYVCFHFGSRKYIYHLSLDKGNRTREQEDAIISAKVIELLLYHLKEKPGQFHQMFSIESQNGQGNVEAPLFLDNGATTLICANNNICMFQLLIESEQLHSILIGANSYQVNPIVENAVILSGSFNPLHQGHLELAHIGAEKLKLQKVYLELSINNADKGSINYSEIWRRIHIMRASGLDIIISNKPLFKDKNIFLKNGAFAIGADTYKRLIDVKYYNNSIPERDISFIKFIQNNNKIVVAPRFNEISQKLEALVDFEIPPLIAKSVIEIQGFRNDISSTQIRKRDNIRAQSTPHLFK